MGFQETRIFCSASLLTAGICPVWQKRGFAPKLLPHPASARSSLGLASRSETEASGPSHRLGSHKQPLGQHNLGHQSGALSLAQFSPPQAPIQKHRSRSTACCSGPNRVCRGLAEGCRGKWRKASSSSGSQHFFYEEIYFVSGNSAIVTFSGMVKNDPVKWLSDLQL